MADLHANPEALPWSDRLELARLLEEALASRTQQEVVFQLIELLADDTDWQVRNAAVNCIIFLPSDRLMKAAARHANDCNAYVVTAVKRVMNRVALSAKESEQRHRELDLLADRYGVFDRLYGKKAAQRARALVENHFDLVANAIVHNLRGTLSGLLDSARKLEAVNEAHLAASAMREKLEFINQNINDLSTYAQEPARERTIEFIAEIVQEALSRARTEPRPRGRVLPNAKVRVNVPREIYAEIARHQIIVALTNIIQNAFESFEFSQKSNDAIAISGCAQDGNVIVTVQDNGPGIPPEDLRVIQQFIPGLTTKKSYGTGFGLPIASRFVEAHGGSIHLECPDGNGLAVMVQFPIKAQKGDRDEIPRAGY